MKKLFLLCVSALFAAGSYAQTSEEVVVMEVQDVQSVSKYPSVRGFVSNGFWDNWELSFGGGLSMMSTSNLVFKDMPGSFGDRLGFEVNVAATKWFHPVFGARLQLAGGRFRNISQLGGNTQRTPYMFVHTDLMINFSNWAGGYRADRAYYAVPFVGFGYMAMDFTDRAHDLGYGTNQELAFTAGLLNKFRIAKGWDLDIELKGMLFGEKDLPASLNSGGAYAVAYSATAGFTHRFNDRNWKRQMPQKYTDADIAAYTAAIAALEGSLAAARNNEKSLADQLAAANKALQDAKGKKEVFVNGACPAFFKINSAALSQRNKILLDLVADEINSSPADKTFTVSGYADKETGSAAYNQKLLRGACPGRSRVPRKQGREGRPPDRQGLRCNGSAFQRQHREQPRRRNQISGTHAYKQKGRTSQCGLSVFPMDAVLQEAGRTSAEAESGVRSKPRRTDRSPEGSKSGRTKSGQERHVHAPDRFLCGRIPPYLTMTALTSRTFETSLIRSRSASR